MSRSWSLLLVFLVISPLAADRPSHKPTGSGLDGSESPESLLAGRLGSPEMKQLAEALKNNEGLRKELAGLATELLKNRKFLESLKGKFNEKELAALKEQFKNTGARPDLNDPKIKKLVDELKGLQNDRTLLDDKQRELLKKWSEKVRPDAPGTSAAPDATGP